MSSAYLHPPLANVAGKHKPQYEYGDAYISTVTQGTHQIDNPLHRTICVKGTSIEQLTEIGLTTYPIADLTLKDVRLWQYLKISVPPKQFEKVRRVLEEQAITIVCIDEPDFVARCLTDVQSSEGGTNEPAGL